MRTKLVVLALAVACLASLPLIAAPEAPEAEVEQRTEAGPATPLVDSETPPAAPAELDIEGILDDGREAMACDQSSCDRYCKSVYGQYSFGSCSGSSCHCAF